MQIYLSLFASLLNNIELNVKTKYIEEKLSHQKVGEDVGTSGAYVSRLINHT